jgi:hypothetical protein
VKWIRRIVGSGAEHACKPHHVHAEEIDEMTDHHSQRWYTTEELAELLKVDTSSVRRWRTAEPLQDPPFIRVSARRTIYNASDVAAWLDRRRVDPSAVA